MILLKNGPYGPYVQLGETSTRKAVPKGTGIMEVDIISPKTFSTSTCAWNYLKQTRRSKQTTDVLVHMLHGQGKNGRILPIYLHLQSIR